VWERRRRRSLEDSSMLNYNLLMLISCVFIREWEIRFWEELID